MQNPNVAPRELLEPEVMDTALPSPTKKIKSIFERAKEKLGVREHSLKESVQEVLEEHLDSESDTLVEREEKLMLRNVLAFSETSVSDVMVPRTDIIAVRQDISFEALRAMLTADVHTRLPVYSESLDDITGFIHIKDLAAIVAQEKPFDMDKILRQALYIPPSMKTSALLVKMQQSRVHIAIVVDEYGSTAGLVTMEDLMEEIFGEIEDEHDVDDGKRIRKINDMELEVSGRANYYDVAEKLGVSFEQEAPNSNEYQTINGLVFELLGRIPAVGETATLNLPSQGYSVEFIVTDSDPRRMRRAHVRKKPLDTSSTNE